MEGGFTNLAVHLNPLDYTWINELPLIAVGMKLVVRSLNMNYMKHQATLLSWIHFYNNIQVAPIWEPLAPFRSSCCQL